MFLVTVDVGAPSYEEKHYVTDSFSKAHDFAKSYIEKMEIYWIEEEEEKEEERARALQELEENISVNSFMVNDIVWCEPVEMI